MGLPKRAQTQRTMDKKRTERIKREYNGRRSNHRRNGQETSQKMKNWTTPGKDEVHRFCIKHLTSLHPRIAQQLNRLLETATIEERLSTRKTILLMKNKNAGAIPSNYRPITCLCTTFKLMTAIIAVGVQPITTLECDLGTLRMCPW